jgi:hypothetical protein
MVVELVPPNLLDMASHFWLASSYHPNRFLASSPPPPFYVSWDSWQRRLRATVSGCTRSTAAGPREMTASPDYSTTAGDTRLTAATRDWRVERDSDGFQLAPTCSYILLSLCLHPLFCSLVSSVCVSPTIHRERQRLTEGLSHSRIYPIISLCVCDSVAALILFQLYRINRREDNISV